MLSVPSWRQRLLVHDLLFWQYSDTRARVPRAVRGEIRRLSIFPVLRAANDNSSVTSRRNIIIFVVFRHEGRTELFCSRCLTFSGGRTFLIILVTSINVIWSPHLAACISKVLLFPEVAVRCSSIYFAGKGTRKHRSQVSNPPHKKSKINTTVKQREEYFVPTAFLFVEFVEWRNLIGRERKKTAYGGICQTK